MTNEARRRKVPRLAMDLRLGLARRAARRFVLRWALRDDLVRVESAVGSQLAMGHDFRFILERVGRLAGKADVDHIARLASANRVVLNLEPVLERVRVVQNRSWNDVALHLKLLAFERRALSDDFVDMLEVFGAFAQRRPHHEAEGRGEHDGRDSNLDISMCHKDFWCEETPVQNSPEAPSVASSRRSSATADTGKPTTLAYEPSMRGMKRDARP